MLLPSWEFTSCLGWPLPSPGETSIYPWYKHRRVQRCVPQKYSSTEPQQEPWWLCSTWWHQCQPGTCPAEPPKNRYENSQIFQPWEDPGGQMTKSCCWNRSQTQVDLPYKICKLEVTPTAYKLEVTPKLKTPLGTPTGNNCVGEWRSPESRGRAWDSISRAAWLYSQAV